MKVTAHHKAEVKPLAVVREEIVDLLKHERGVAAAKAPPKPRSRSSRPAKNSTPLAKTQNVTRGAARFIGRGDPSIPAALRTSIFEAPRPAAASRCSHRALDDGSTAVYAVTRTRVADADANPALDRAA